VAFGRKGERLRGYRGEGVGQQKGRLMRKLALVLAGLAALVSVWVLATPVAAASKPTHIAIKDQGSTLSFKGKFTVELNYVGRFDSGKSKIQPYQQDVKVVDGQNQQVVSGYDTFTGTKGTLKLSFEGVDLTVPGGTDGLHGEYGTWKLVTSGCTRAYKGWTGHGRWAAVTDGTYSLEWDGFVTH
jgi:hypothetical protein